MRKLFPFLLIFFCRTFIKCTRSNQKPYRVFYRYKISLFFLPKQFIRNSKAKMWKETIDIGGIFNIAHDSEALCKFMLFCCFFNFLLGFCGNFHKTILNIFLLFYSHFVSFRFFASLNLVQAKNAASIKQQNGLFH